MSLTKIFVFVFLNRKKTLHTTTVTTFNGPQSRLIPVSQLQKHTTYNLCSAHSYSIIITVAPIPFSNFPPFTTIHSITRFKCKSITFLSTTFFPRFPGPASLSGTFNLQSNIFSHSIINHHYRESKFYWTVKTITKWLTQIQNVF